MLGGPCHMARMAPLLEGPARIAYLLPYNVHHSLYNSLAYPYLTNCNYLQYRLGFELLPIEEIMCTMEAGCPNCGWEILCITCY